ncbi:HlyC/CorC family transporter [Xylanivirga thermophila]|uniref:HlyC/CorC family transporter n=1 Tax=Xylanivirga thermophila TaxID=2496273 RepID=UPI00101C1943|nr:hemolysin family protein [Xylanivirga thermophila]
MDPDGTWQIISLIILLFLSAFFSASETALMAISKIRIKHMTEEKVKGSELVTKLIEKPNKLLGAILVGNNLTNVGASAIATSIAIDRFGSTGVGIATGIMTLLLLIFGEITPKTLAVNNSEKFALKVAKPIYVITVIFAPIVNLFTKATNGVIKLLGGKVENQDPFITEDELKTIVNVSYEEGVLEDNEKEFIYNVFEFGDSQVGDVMIPRIDMIAIEVETSYQEILNIIKEKRYSRMPVYKDNIDNIIGIIHIKDLVGINGESKNFDITKYLKEPFYTFEFKNTAELFEDMRKNRVSMSIVLDEYGGTVGLITMEDLVEEIVGDIDDEYDDYDDDIEIINNNEYIVKGNTKIDLVNETLGLNIESDDLDSIGGFIIGQLGRMPKAGENLEWKNVNFIVENVRKNRIDTLKIIRKSQNETATF